MKHLLLLSGFVCSVLLTPLSSLYAQKDDEPAMSVILSSADELKLDLKCMLDLTTPAEQKQWKNVKANLDEVFLLGIDGKRLHRYDLISGPEGMDYRCSFPLDKEKDFVDSLELFGIDVRRRARNFYSLSNAYTGIMRIVDKYAVTGQSDVVGRRFTPIDAMMKKYVLQADGKTPKHDLMFLLLTDHIKPANRKDLYASYADVKKELMAAVKQAEEESKEDFELRRALTELQIDEMGRYYTDPRELLIAWTLDEEKTKKGTTLIDLLPEEGTPLAQAVAELATTPSRYEALVEPEGKILSGRINLPLDDQQKENLIKVVQLLADRGKAEAQASETLNDEQKKAMEQVVTLLSASAVDTVKSGRFDGFVHCRPSKDGKYTLIGSAQLANAGNLNAALKQIQIARPDRTIKAGVDEHEGVTFHEIQVSPTDEPQYEDLCGSNKFHIGVGQNEFWYAIGIDSIDALKAAITATNAKADLKPSQEFISLHLKPGPLVAWRNRHVKPKEPQKIQTVSGETPDKEKKIQVDSAVLLKQAIEAFEPGDDNLILSFKKEEDRVKGTVSVDTGILRMVGKMIAQFSKDTLEE